MSITIVQSTAVIQSVAGFGPFPDVFLTDDPTPGNVLYAIIVSNTPELVDTTQWTIVAYLFPPTETTPYLIVARIVQPGDGITPPPWTLASNNWIETPLGMWEVSGSDGTITFVNSASNNGSSGVNIDVSGPNTIDGTVSFGVWYFTNPAANSGIFFSPYGLDQTVFSSDGATRAGFGHAEYASAGLDTSMTVSIGPPASTFQSAAIAILRPGVPVPPPKSEVLFEQSFNTLNWTRPWTE